jgi:uncharacterized membrane protein
MVNLSIIQNAEIIVAVFIFLIVDEYCADWTIPIVIDYEEKSRLIALRKIIGANAR